MTSETLHGCFEQQAERTPQSIAVVSGSRSMTFAHLNAAANRLAHRLEQAGASRGGTVALALPSGPLLAVALLAVLKSGAAYVPLDAKAPVGRREFVLAETAPVVVLTDTNGGDGLFPDRFVVVVTENDVFRSDDIGSGSERNSERPVSGDDLAYVTYTSGSTGRPKGVMVTHANLVSFGFAALSAYGLTAEDRFLQLAPVSFDVHAEEIFPVWLAGGSVAFTDNGLVSTSPQALMKVVARLGVTIAEVTTAYWYEVLRALTESKAEFGAQFKRLLMGGERASAEAYARWRGTGIALTHVYGLTETAVTSTTFDDDSSDGWESVPVGTPMKHAAVYVVDKTLRPVAQGEVGEVCIGGPGVARGYLNAPALTAARFVPDPHSPVAGARMYRTGDMGRWLHNGNLEFISRVDNQIKIRGHRVELGEVEAALLRCPGVDQAVVVAYQKDAGDVRLVAYVRGELAAVDDVAVRLRQELPGYMVPERVVALEVYPLTKNGKVDRAELVSRSQAGQMSSTVLERPKDPAAARMIDIWSDLIGRRDLGVDQNFFELGGHSLLAVRLLAEVERVTGVEVPLTDFLKKPTVNGVCAAVARGRDRVGTDVITVRPRSRG